MHGGALLERNRRISAFEVLLQGPVYDEYVARIMDRLCNRILRKISTEFMPYDWINTFHDVSMNRHGCQNGVVRYGFHLYSAVVGLCVA